MRTDKWLYETNEEGSEPRSEEGSGETFRIWHLYDEGDESEYVARRRGSVCPARASVLVWFICEEYYGPTANISNEGIAAALVEFYGFERCGRVQQAVPLEQWSLRESFCAPPCCFELRGDVSLWRDGLAEFMRPYVNL